MVACVGGAAYWAVLCWAAALGADAGAAPGRPKPAAAKRASMSFVGGGMIGVSGGGGDPLVARVVITDAVESMRATPDPVGFNGVPPGFAAAEPLVGAGQCCCWKSGY